MKNFIRRSFIIAAAVSLVSTLQTTAEFSWEDHYEFENIATPKGIDPQVGGMALNKQGQLVVCFHRGEVMIYDEPTNQWSMFASGLHEPLGLHLEEDGNILVIQRAELTRLRDTDNDGAILTGCLSTIYQPFILLVWFRVI